jgi:hypothetical protein
MILKKKSNINHFFCFEVNCDLLEHFTVFTQKTKAVRNTSLKYNLRTLWWFKQFFGKIW